MTLGRVGFILSCAKRENGDMIKFNNAGVDAD